MKVYDGRVWKHGKLWLTARDIVASSEAAAAPNIVTALRHRPGLGTDKTLMALSRHVYGYGPCPEGVHLDVKQVAEGPSCTGPCVTVG